MKFHSRNMVLLLLGSVLLFAATFSACSTAAEPPASSSQASAASTLQGTDLGKAIAPAFRLTDQHGQQVSLAQFKGMPVILTFFYTHCPNYCPLIAEKIHTTLTELGSGAQHVAILAISADPIGDTPASVATFSQEHRLAGYANWHYLLGKRQVLSPIWSSYHVSGVPPYAKTMSMSAMSHSSLVYVIDQQGRERVLLDSDFAPDQLAHDIRTLQQSGS